MYSRCIKKLFKIIFKKNPVFGDRFRSFIDGKSKVSCTLLSLVCTKTCSVYFVNCYIFWMHCVQERLVLRKRMAASHNERSHAIRNNVYIYNIIYGRRLSSLLFFIWYTYMLLFFLYIESYIINSDNECVGPAVKEIITIIITRTDLPNAMLIYKYGVHIIAPE